MTRRRSVVVLPGQDEVVRDHELPQNVSSRDLADAMQMIVRRAEVHPDVAVPFLAAAVADLDAEDDIRHATRRADDLLTDLAGDLNPTAHAHRKACLESVRVTGAGRIGMQLRDPLGDFQVRATTIALADLLGVLNALDDGVAAELLDVAAETQEAARPCDVDDLPSMLEAAAGFARHEGVLAAVDMIASSLRTAARSRNVFCRRLRDRVVGALTVAAYARGILPPVDDQRFPDAQLFRKDADSLLESALIGASGRCHLRDLASADEAEIVSEAFETGRTHFEVGIELAKKLGLSRTGELLWEANRLGGTPPDLRPARAAAEIVVRPFAFAMDRAGLLARDRDHILDSFVRHVRSAAADTPIRSAMATTARQAFADFARGS